MAKIDEPGNIRLIAPFSSRSFAKVAGWLKCNGLVLNLNKTKHMVFGSNVSVVEGSMNPRNHDPTCDLHECNCEIIERVSIYKYLGLYIDESLKFGTHVSKLMAKLRSGVAVLYRLRHLGTVSLRKTIYSALIESHLAYMIVVYGGTFDVILEPIIKLQKLAIRNVCRTGLRELSRCSGRQVRSAFTGCTAFVF